MVGRAYTFLRKIMGISQTNRSRKSPPPTPEIQPTKVRRNQFSAYCGSTESALLMPLTRLIVGTSIGTKGAIFPLVVGTVPFFSRQIHAALCEIDPGTVEAAKSMGSSPVGIICRVYLREGLPGMIRGAAITIVNLFALSAMAGCVGGGGLGDYAIRYGFQRYQTDATIVTVIILLVLITIVQSIGNLLTRKMQ